jgi:hypothetical protein
LIDEYLTSKISSETGELLMKVVEKTEKGSREVRGLRWCCSTFGSKFVCRDLNSAKNMINCYNSYPTRPKGLERKEKQIQLTHYINKSTEGVSKVTRVSV